MIEKDLQTVLEKDADSPSVDSFGRERFSTPTTLFDSQFTYSLQPLLFEQITSGSGMTITHDTTNRCAKLRASGSNTFVGAKTVMSSFEHFRYQPGKSQMAFISFNFHTGSSEVLKYVRYGDDNNAIEFSLTGSTPQFRLLSDTDLGDVTVHQSSWNLDTLGGYPKYNLDMSKTQIFVLDLQALYSGRVRVGFDFDGQILYAHQFTHANSSVYPFIQTANLPIQAGIQVNSTASVSESLDLICATVISEGGNEDLVGYSFSISGSGSAGADTRTTLITLRPSASFNGITNRSKIVLEDVNIIAKSATPIYWELVLGNTLHPTQSFQAVNQYSTVEYYNTATASVAPQIVVDSGYVAASNQSKTAVKSTTNLRYPITLDNAGSARTLGTVSLIVTGLGGASDCNASIKWKEIR